MLPTLFCTKYPRPQILTIEDLLAGKKIDVPALREQQTFRKAPKAKSTVPDEQHKMFDG